MAQESFLNPQMPDIIQQWEHYLSLVNPREGEVILDVGCNSGDTERYIFSHYPCVKKIVGLDNDPARVHKAKDNLSDLIESASVEVVLGDARSLPFDDNSFDKIICAETLEWVKDPELALTEMYRVLRPGGTVLIQHSDFDTQVFAVDNLDLLREFIHEFCDSGPDGVIGRRLFGLCKSIGFKEVQPSVYPLINVEFDELTYSYRVFMMMKDWLLKKKLMEREQLDKLYNLVLKTVEEKRFFYSINRNICICKK